MVTVDHIELNDKSERDLIIIVVTKLNGIADDIAESNKVQRTLREDVTTLQSRCETIHGNPELSQPSKKRQLLTTGGLMGICIGIWEGIRQLIWFIKG